MGWSRSDEDYRADHYRDHAKHDDTPPLYAQSARVSGALEVAILVKAVPLQQAAELIEAYGRAEAAAARVDATAEAIDRCCNAIEKAGAVDA